MSLISIMTIACGILFSKTLLYYTLVQPFIRYGLSVLFSYFIFFALIYIWLLWYFGSKIILKNSADLNAVDFSDSNTLPSANSSEPYWVGSGGESSGGGASDFWGNVQCELIPSKNSSSSQETSGSSIPDIDEFVIVAILIVIFFLIAGSAFYFIYQAPEILFDAAFEIILVAGLFRKGKKIQNEGWAQSIFKRTWIPFAVVFIFVIIFGLVIKFQCPAAHSFGEYRSLCWGQN